MGGQPIVTDIAQGVGLTTPAPAVRTVKVLLSPLLQEGLEDFLVGITEVPPNGEGTRHNHPHATEVWLFFAGRGRAIFGDREYPTGPGTVVYTPSGTFHPVHQHARRTGQALLPVRPRRRGASHPGRRVSVTRCRYHAHCDPPNRCALVPRSRNHPWFWLYPAPSTATSLVPRACGLKAVQPSATAHGVGPRAEIAFRGVPA